MTHNNDSYLLKNHHSWYHFDPCTWIFSNRKTPYTLSSKTKYHKSLQFVLIWEIKLIWKNQNAKSDFHVLEYLVPRKSFVQYESYQWVIYMNHAKIQWMHIKSFKTRNFQKKFKIGEAKNFFRSRTMSASQKFHFLERTEIFFVFRRDIPFVQNEPRELFKSHFMVTMVGFKLYSDEFIPMDLFRWIFIANLMI